MPALAICLLHLHLPPMFSLGPLLKCTEASFPGMLYLHYDMAIPLLGASLNCK